MTRHSDDAVTAYDPRVRRQRRQSPDWHDKLILTEKYAPRPLLANAITVLRLAPEWSALLWHNDFTGATTARNPPPWEADNAGWQERPWTDHDDLLAAEWLQRAGIHVRVEIAAQAVQAVAGERSFHPVQDYLSGRTLDGTPRLDNWLVSYLGVETSPYARAVGRRFLISAVARIYEPGCKADCALILEGPQGIGKSTALKILTEPWFTDEIGDFGSKDAAQQTLGVWLVELAELGSLTRPEVGRIKAFMSRPADRFRPPYGRRVMEFPRQCVFAGTVNEDGYLRDPTGGRRFWPVRCGSIDLQGLGTARDQIWAEAVKCFKAGEPWWLDTAELRSLAIKEQAARYQGDPWDDLISEYVQDKASVSVDEILTNVLHIDEGRRTQQDQTRVARCLKSRGLRRYQARRGEKRCWCYRPVVGSSAK